METLLLHSIKASNTHSSAEDIDTFNKVIIEHNTSHTPLSTTLATLIKTSKTLKNTYTKALKVEAEVRKEEMRYVTVKSGDSLFKIAKRIYGDAMKYTLIFEANSDVLKKSTDLSIGQKLRVPQLKESQK
ncbi:MAG: LysM peptidoglycan-binding domain-containing protein [Sulfurovum sp.]|nr:LysM peptidoglycan-binding domain-containing protein [Sulfurovum sp.]